MDIRITINDDELVPRAELNEVHALLRVEAKSAADLRGVLDSHIAHGRAAALKAERRDRDLRIANASIDRMSLERESLLAEVEHLRGRVAALLGQLHATGSALRSAGAHAAQQL